MMTLIYWALNASHFSKSLACCCLILSLQQSSEASSAIIPTSGLKTMAHSERNDRMLGFHPFADWGLRRIREGTRQE